MALADLLVDQAVIVTREPIQRDALGNQVFGEVGRHATRCRIQRSHGKERLSGQTTDEVTARIYLPDGVDIDRHSRVMCGPDEWDVTGSPVRDVSPMTGQALISADLVAVRG